MNQGFGRRPVQKILLSLVSVRFGAVQNNLRIAFDGLQYFIGFCSQKGSVFYDVGLIASRNENPNLPNLVINQMFYSMSLCFEDFI